MRVGSRCFDVCRDIELRGWTLGLQRNLPQSIGVQRATRMPVGYNPRFDTVTKRYRYLLSPGRVHSPCLLVGLGACLNLLLLRRGRGWAEWHALEGTWTLLIFVRQGRAHQHRTPS